MFVGRLVGYGGRSGQQGLADASALSLHLGRGRSGHSLQRVPAPAAAHTRPHAAPPLARSDGVRDIYSAEGGAIEPGAPLVVLANRGTASASEVGRRLALWDEV